MSLDGNANSKANKGMMHNVMQLRFWRPRYHVNCHHRLTNLFPHAKQIAAETEWSMDGMQSVSKDEESMSSVQSVSKDKESIDVLF